MIEAKIQAILDDLAEAQAQRDLLRIDRDAAIAAATPPLPPQAAAEIAAIEAEAEDKFQAVDERITELSALARQAVMSYGKSVKAERLHAVFSTRTSWNGRGLKGYAVAYPEILEFAKTSTSVSIRKR